MLDWDEEELASILWGEVPETEDHIVPYSEGNGSRLQTGEDKGMKKVNKESSSQECSKKMAPDKTDWMKEIGSVCNPDEQNLSSLGVKALSNPNSLNAVTGHHDSIGTNVPIRAATGGNPQNQLEEQDNAEFVDYSWADIESFGDLDKIFSNDEPMFGNTGLANVDELWSTSKDADYSLEKSFPSTVDSPTSYEKVSDQYNIKSECSEPIFGNDNIRDSISCGQSDVGASTDDIRGKAKIKLIENMVDRAGKDTVSPGHGSTLNKFANKMNKQKKIRNPKGLDQRGKGKSLHSPYGPQYLPGSQFQQFGKQEVASMVHSYPFLDPRQQQHGMVQHGSNQFAVPSTCEGYNQYTGMSLLPQIHCVQGTQQHRFPDYEIQDYEIPHGNSYQNTSYAPVKPILMTPQEKIEKLRRRQQMQALLAIKKQQQELSHQATSSDIDHPINMKHPQDSQTEITDGTEGTDINPPSFDPSCSLEKEMSDGNNKKASVDIPVEDSTLFQLQDIVSKLDSKVRLCLRDSLFRLANSAAQRHYPTDTGSANNNAQEEDHMLADGEIRNHDRSVSMVDAETETNPIDRTVAHLLFHRPFDAIVQHPETPKLPLCTQPERKISPLIDIPTGCSMDGNEIEQSAPHKESESKPAATEIHPGTQLLNSSCMIVPQNAMSSEPQGHATIEPNPPNS